MSKEIGLSFIAREANMSYAELAEKLGVSRQQINSWVNKHRPIPKKRLSQLQKIFDVPEEYFNKELTKSEELEIQILKLEQENEHDRVVRYLTDEKNRIEKVENLLKDINKLVVNKRINNKDPDTEEAMRTTYDTVNLDILQTVVNILNSKNEEQKIALRIFSTLIDCEKGADGDEHFDFDQILFKPGLILYPYHTTKFGKDFMDLLFNHGVLSNKGLKNILKNERGEIGC